MGCGASKNPNNAPAVPQDKAKADSTTTPKAAASATKPADEAKVQSTSTNGTDVQQVIKQASLKVDYGAGIANPSSVDGPSNPANADGGDTQASAQDRTSGGVGSSWDATDRGRSPERSEEAPETENPARAGFRAAFSGLTATDGSPAPAQAPITFKSSRSLNRSIGVRRRTSDNGGQGDSATGSDGGAAGGGGEAPGRREEQSDDEAVMNSPDSVLEQFERMKGVNPLLRKVTEKSMMPRPSEKAKSQKRLAVGFAIEGAGERGAGEGAAVEVTVAAGTAGGGPDATSSGPEAESGYGARPVPAAAAAGGVAS